MRWDFLYLREGQSLIVIVPIKTGYLDSLLD